MLTQVPLVTVQRPAKRGYYCSQDRRNNCSLPLVHYSGLLAVLISPIILLKMSLALSIAAVLKTTILLKLCMFSLSGFVVFYSTGNM